ncbi:hypothetical protein [Dokdonia sp.]|uniref:hypothetical protein n=1 Tax=Dokdonia sp. TaxID=2024995 RepID=UPI0032669A1A
MIRILIVLVAVLISSSTMNAQGVKTLEGDISKLIGEKELSVTFSYENMMVHGFNSEEEFIEAKVRLREEHKPGTGEGERFRGSWFADRDSVFEPAFIKYINHKLPKKRKINVVENNPDATYNLHVQTLWTYPGYNVGFAQPAKIEVALSLYEISNPDVILWKAKNPYRVEAGIAPYKRELRIAAAYAKLSLNISWFFKRKLK